MPDFSANYILSLRSMRKEGSLSTQVFTVSANQCALNEMRLLSLNDSPEFSFCTVAIIIAMLFPACTLTITALILAHDYKASHTSRFEPYKVLN